VNRRWHGAAGLVLALLAACSNTGHGSAPAAANPNASAGAGAAGTHVWSRSMEARRLALEKATRNTGIEVLRTRTDELQVNVPSEFSFDSGSAELKPDMKRVLDEFARDLELPSLQHLTIHIVGHADSTGPDAVNDPLSVARADSVRKHFVARGIAAARIEVEGRGEHQPLVDNAKPYGRALNRRVEIVLREPGRS
jgi:outer membrane protein OmpA-like peptidoglycan-associated protein